MNLVSKVERWLETSFARLFAGRASTARDMHKVRDDRDNGEVLDGCPVRAKSLQQEKSASDSSEDNAWVTNRFLLRSQSERCSPNSGKEKTITRQRPFGYVLEMVKGPNSGTIFHGVARECLIGRSNECDLVICDTTVSRYHAKLSFDGFRWSVQDLDSTNGTYVNGYSTTKTYLKDNDILKLGMTELKFKSVKR